MQQTPLPPSNRYANADTIIARAKSLRDRQNMINGYKQKQQVNNTVTWIATLVIIGLIVFFTVINWSKLSPIVGKAFNQLRTGNTPSLTATTDCRILEFASDGGLKEFPTVGSKWCIADQNRATWLLYNDKSTIDALAQKIVEVNGESDKETVAKAIETSFSTFVIDLQSPPSVAVVVTEPVPVIPTTKPIPTEELQPTATPAPTSTATSLPPTEIILPTKELTPTPKPTEIATEEPTTFNINQIPDEHPIIPVSQLKQWSTRWNIPFIIMSSDDLSTRGNHCIDNQITTWPIVEFEYNKGAFEGFGYFYVDFTELQNMGYRSAMGGCPGFFSKYFIGDKNNVGLWNVVQEFDMYFAPWEKGPSILP